VTDDPAPTRAPVDLTAAGRDVAGVIALVTAVVLHLVVGVFVLASGLLAPGWAVALLVAAWGACWVPVWRWRRTHPIRTMLVPFAMATVWWLTITAGDAWLGWAP
jgi:hypothetical protein